MSKRAILALFIALLLTGCTVIASFQPTETPTPTPEPPTPTPIPAAAIVNGERIPLDEYTASLKQLQDAQAAIGTTSTPEPDAAGQRRMVLDDLIGQTLLAQGAAEAGFAIDDSALQAKIDALTEKLGGQDKLADWIIRMGYTEDSFRRALRRADAAAWQRDQIIATVPTTAEQVHARQILVQHVETANDLFAQLQAGADFATLAYRYDPLTGGDLGWFPRGYLIQPAVEEAAFALQPGGYSPVIQTSYGYHLVYVIERDEKHALSPDALKQKQRLAIQLWIDERKAKSEIEIVAP